jgi:hypothetical protein
LLLPIYFAEIVIDYRIGVTRRKQSWTSYLSSWTCLRFVSLLLILLDCIVFFANHRTGRISRALFPFLIISRDEQLRKILHGVLRSFRKSTPVYLLLGAVLAMWTLLGYFLLQRVSIDSARRFNNLYQSFGTILQCFSSSPFALFVVVPYAEEYSRGIQFFFLLVTLSTELLVVNLIVAVGNAALMRFAERTIRARLTFRLVAILSIWSLYSLTIEGQTELSEEYMSLEAWLELCKGFKGTRRIDEATARDMLHFIRQQVRLQQSGNEEQHTLSSTLLEQMLRKCSELDLLPLSSLPDDSIGLVEFVRLLALVSAHSRIQNQSHLKYSEAAVRDSILTAGLEMKSINASSCSEANDNIHDMTKVIYILDKPTAIFYSLAHIFSPISNLCHNILAQNLECCVWGKLYHMPLVSAIAIEMRILLAIVTVYLSATSSSNTFHAWLGASYLLEIYFWSEMIVYLFALGLRAFCRRFFHFFSLLLNISSFICLCVIGPHAQSIFDGSKSSTRPLSALAVFIFISCLRLATTLTFVFSKRRAKRHHHLHLVAFAYLRILFLIATLIYCYSIFAHEAFCGLLEKDRVEPESSYDDDSSSWLNFASILNFNSHMQSMFTMFQVMVLGSWTMVMDAATKVVYISPYFFFFIYRLSLTLVLLPLLLSFVIRSYILALDQQEQHSEEDSHTDATPATAAASFSLRIVHADMIDHPRRKKDHDSSVADDFIGLWALDVDSGGKNKNTATHRKLCSLSMEIENLAARLDYYRKHYSSRPQKE